MGMIMLTCGVILGIGLTSIYLLALSDGSESEFWRCSHNCGLYEYLISLVGVTGLKWLVTVVLLGSCLSAVAWGVKLLTGRSRLK